MAEAGLRVAELFMKEWHALGELDFATLAEAEAQLKAHIERHADDAHDPTWFHKKYAWGYHKRFIRGTVMDAVRISRSGGKLVTKLPEQWKFATDQQGVGVEKKWYAPAFDDSQWRTVGTFTQSWADLGIGFAGMYHGDTWYRTTFDIPADAKGKDLRLWFGGFDNNVDVYLNGAHSASTTGFMRPAEFKKINAALRFGAENAIAVRCEFRFAVGNGHGRHHDAGDDLRRAGRFR